MITIFHNDQKSCLKFLNALSRIFQQTVDSRSDEVVEAYEEAAEERNKGDKNGFEAGKVLAIFDGEATENDWKHNPMPSLHLYCLSNTVS